MMAGVNGPHYWITRRVGKAPGGEGVWTECAVTGFRLMVYDSI